MGKLMVGCVNKIERGNKNNSSLIYDLAWGICHNLEKNFATFASLTFLSQAFDFANA